MRGLLLFAVLHIGCARPATRADDDMTLLVPNDEIRVGSQAEARARYNAGMAHFQLGEWEKAIGEWQEGFRVAPMPQFLFNIAQAYRGSKKPDRAITFYEKYLRMDPSAPNRYQVRKTIDALRAH
jgi:tetratricopeptide (TPR) repeat protein